MAIYVLVQQEFFLLLPLTETKDGPSGASPFHGKGFFFFYGEASAATKLQAAAELQASAATNLQASAVTDQ